MNCVFCSHPDQAGTIVFEDDSTLVLVHPDWATAGHLMVVWKGHVENLSDLTEEEAIRFLGVYRRAERAVLAITTRERAVMLKLGIMTPHLHLHIYPVSSELDRNHVMAIVDAKGSDSSSERERAVLVDALRRRLGVRDDPETR